jgi:hypothetical protein
LDRVKDDQYLVQFYNPRDGSELFCQVESADFFTQPGTYLYPTGQALTAALDLASNGGRPQMPALLLEVGNRAFADTTCGGKVILSHIQQRARGATLGAGDIHMASVTTDSFVAQFYLLSEIYVAFLMQYTLKREQAGSEFAPRNRP